ncbi:MAG: DUF2252 family protein [Streptosporangiaceae bacterium]
MALLEEQNATREPDLVPVWHGRMMVSPFTFYRSAAKGSALVEYLGRDDAFDQSISDFPQRYVDQNEKDYEEFVKAIKSGRLEAAEGV